MDDDLENCGRGRCAKGACAGARGVGRRGNVFGSDGWWDLGWRAREMGVGTRSCGPRMEAILEGVGRAPRVGQRERWDVVDFVLFVLMCVYIYVDDD